MNFIASMNSAIHSVVWGTPMMILILGSGIYFTIGIRFLQFSHFFTIIKETIGKSLKKEEITQGSVTSRQALTTALAATVGTGNIAGVAGAIAVGGPGAIFWMWVSALVSMATKFAEVTLAIHYREKNAQGEWVGGPMYYIQKGLGKNFRPLGMIFALFASLAAFGIGNMTQANTIAQSAFTTIVDFSPSLLWAEQGIKLATGMILALICSMVLLGGVKRVGIVTEKLVPTMATFYMIACLYVIFSNISSLGSVLSGIIQSAFCPDSVLGAGVGITVSTALRCGVGRGLFSNEAGLGSAPIAHASAQTDFAVKQGFFGIFEVFVDTIVIGSLTGVTILISGIPIGYGSEVGVELSIAAFSSVFYSHLSSVLVAIGLSLFAISTILSWGLYGTRCCQYLFGESATKTYQIIFLIFIVIGSIMDLGLVWDIAETLNGMMAIPNLIGILCLSGTVFRLSKEYLDVLKSNDKSKL